MRALIGFDGPVRCHAGSGAIGWSLAGVVGAAPTAHDTEVLFSGCRAIEPAPPAILHEVRVLELDAAGSLRRFEIRSREGDFTVLARSAQLHGEVSAEFFAALPRVATPWLVRAGWSLLLRLLRWPPVAALVGRRKP